MKAWYKVFNKVLSLEECVKLVSNTKRMGLNEATVGYGGKSTVDQNIRKSNIAWLPRDETELDWLWKRIEHCTHKANSELFGLDISHFESVQFTEYEGSQSQHYDWHQDNSFVVTPDRWKPFDRKLSVCIQLSDPSQYDGGSFEINPRNPIKVSEFKQAGDLIVFPSFLWHKVNPVTWGTRHSLVTWWEGPRFR